MREGFDQRLRSLNGDECDSSCGIGEELEPRGLFSPGNVTECDGKPVIGVSVTVTSSQDHSSK